MFIKKFFKKFYNFYINYKVCSVCQKKLVKEKYKIEEDYYCKSCCEFLVFEQMRSISMRPISELPQTEEVFIGFWVEDGQLTGNTLYKDQKKGLCIPSGEHYSNAEKVMYCISLPRFIQSQINKK